MKILVLNGSPHLNGTTSDMVKAFAAGAGDAGHEVTEINVAHKNIRGCMACEYCREKETGVCCQKDDMQEMRKCMGSQGKRSPQSVSIQRCMSVGRRAGRCSVWQKKSGMSVRKQNEV